MSTVRIGTRGSKLALWQAENVADMLKTAGLSTDIITITTKGDKIQDRSLSKIGSKGVFTEELEEQLLNNSIDIAVHSAKDMQTDLGPDLELIAFTKREKVNDVLVAVTGEGSILNSPSRIGTSATRRVALLKKHYPQAQTVEIRGNLQTRFKKLEEGQADALLLAYAGVARMDMGQYIIKEFDTDEFTPAVGQGSMVIEASQGLDTELKAKITQATNDDEAFHCVSTERAFLKEFGGGCSIPVFGLATLNDDQITLNGGIISLDGSQIIREKIVGNKNDYEQIGIELANRVLSTGGDKILEEIKKQL